MRKKKNKNKFPSSEQKYMLFSVATMILLVVTICGISSFLSHNIKAGECYLDRAYGPVEVTHTSSNRIKFRPQKIEKPTDYITYFLVNDYTKDEYAADPKYVKKYYTKIPCIN